MNEKRKIRTIITQDAEVDDQNSLRHFLFYANEMELQGIVQTSSIFHWIGMPGAKRKERTISEHEFPGTVEEPYDKPYRWTGTDWMFRTVDDYEKDYPKLSRHAEGYPTPDELRAMIKIGNVGYPGEMEHPTEGSELIREKILDEDPRTLYLQVWGFRTLENFTYGGISGRYVKEHGQRNSKGEELNVWNVVKDWYTDRDGNETEVESMWQYVADIQRDFAAHAGWCDAESDGEYRPQFHIDHGVDYTVKPGERLTFRILPDTQMDRTDSSVSNTAYTWKIYKEASAACAAGLLVKAESLSGTLDIPADAKSGDQIHVIVKAQGSGHYHLTYYQQIILSVA